MNSSKNVFSYIEKGKPILPSKRYIQNANFASISLQTLLSKLCRHISICEKLAWLPARSDDLNSLLLDDYQRPLRRSTKKRNFQHSGQNPMNPRMVSWMESNSLRRHLSITRLWKRHPEKGFGFLLMCRTKYVSVSGVNTPFRLLPQGIVTTTFIQMQ